MNPPSHLPPHNISLGYPHAPAPSMLYPASDIDADIVCSFLIALGSVVELSEYMEVLHTFAQFNPQ